MHAHVITHMYYARTHTFDTGTLFKLVVPEEARKSLPFYVIRRFLGVFTVSVFSQINRLQTKSNLLYIRNQSVPRCKHFPPRL